MATPQEQYITDPVQLQESLLAVKLSDLDLADNLHDSDSEDTTQHAAPRLRLALLQPLVDPAIFAVCRPPASTITRFPDGQVSEVENLDISALGKAWRQAMVKLPPISHITFDLSLPKPVDDSEAAQKIYWNPTLALPRTGKHAAILPRNVKRLVASIATMTRMRAQGDVHFELHYGDEAEGVGTVDRDI